MREAAFVKRNQHRWQAIEKELRPGVRITPDRLAEIFIQLTDDLSFARTQYPDSRTVTFLNTLASKIHLEIYKNKREHTNRVVNFWKYELPRVIYNVRKPLLYSFLIFGVTTLIGVVSSLFDDTFVRLILGDFYVNKTLQNIESGNATAIYGSSQQLDMFAQITVNNIFVSFKAFAFGLFTSIGTGYYLFVNGLMLGAFLTMFYNEGQLAQAAPVIMLHGTIELTSIVIAGAAGIAMGNGILFPGTYSRLEGFKRGAMQGLKIVMGLVPFFIVAGFIESYVTRFAFMHWSLKAIVIGASACVMIYYFIIYPFRLHKHATRYNPGI
ncbi:MAG: stage II sporulation protein M [Bacteroidia bacterium]|nr:stage II sporulation protein M [Bacteroidia bacterium]